MSIQPIQYLEWDTQQLGIPTGKITLSGTHLSALRDILAEAKQQKLQLLYLLLPSEAKDAITEAENLGGFLADHKITYLKNLVSNSAILEIDNNIIIYPEKTVSDDLLNLAYESGKYSRFRMDSKITEANFKKIYEQWITNSVNHTVADEVLIYTNKEKILGMITLGEKNHRGDIGLLAVDENSRGQQIGTKLIQAAQNYFIQKNYQQSQVVTQQANIPACKLYEKCGYTIEKIEYFYHFWL